MESREPIALKLVLEMQKWNKSTNRAQRVDEKIEGHSSSYVYSHSYGHQNVKNGLFYVLTAEYSKNQFGKDI